MITDEGEELIRRLGEENAPAVYPRLEMRTAEGVVLFVQEDQRLRLVPGDELHLDWKYEGPTP